MDKKSLPVSLYCFSAIFISLCLWLSIYVPPFADDFCHANDMNLSASWWSYVYENWANLNGRWATSLLRYSYDIINSVDQIYWLVTPLSLFFIYSGSYCIVRASKILDRLASLNLALLLGTIFILIASKLSSLLYWATGMTDYTIGYMLLGLACYLVFQQRSLLAKGICIFVVLFATGLSELMLVPLGLMLAGRWLTDRKSLFTITLLIVFCFGAALNIFAPGNMARLDRVDQQIDLFLIIKETLFYGLRGVILPLIAMYLISHLPVVRKQFDSLVTKIEAWPRCLLISLVLFAFAFPFIVIFALELSLGAPGPGRAHNVSLFVFIVLWPVTYTQLPFLRPKNYENNLVNIAFCVLASLLVFGVNFKDVTEDIISSDAKRHSQAIAVVRENLYLKVNQGKDVVVSKAQHDKPNVAMGGNNLFTHDSSYWLNQCIARYHGNQSVRFERPK